MEAVNALLEDANVGIYGDSMEEDGWTGIQDDDTLVEQVDHREEYMDEDRYTTVTVEAVEVSKEGLLKVAEDDSQEVSESEVMKPEKEESGKKIWPKKPRKKKFRYESKAERKVTRGKQKAGSKSRADARRGNG